MAKKSKVDLDPVLEALCDGMQHSYSAIMIYAFREGGPELSRSVLEALEWRLNEVKKDAETVIGQITEEMSTQGKG